MSDDILRFENVSKTFPGVKALKDVSFSIRRGDVHVLLGENGAGKSTLIKILTGVYQADEGGAIYLNNTPVKIHDTLQSRSLGIGTVFQENSLIPHLNVAENVFLTRELRSKSGAVDWNRTYQECERWIRELGVDHINPRTQVRRLSVADQQIVEIVKVFSQNPSIVILDEPTSALSDNEIDNLFRIIETLKAKGVTFIYVSHRMEEIKRIGDRATIFRDGAVTGEIEDCKTADMDQVINMIVGRTLEEKFPHRESHIGDVLLDVRDLQVPNTIYDISFQVRKGEVLGFSGLVGSGRTSTAKAIVGAIQRTAGEIWIGGEKVKITSPSEAIEHGIGYLPEDRKTEGLILSKSVKENISLPSLLKKFRRGIVLDGRKERAAAEEYREKLRIKTPSINRLVNFLSGGNQQKVVFAKWLCSEANIYIFDEPTRGIDVGAKSEIYQIINDLVSQGAAVIVISSELPEILGICDRIIVMRDGRITADLDRADATQELIMSYSI
ncbi:sugar ABC transporter ATP-binding protein [Oscillibacter valericigenes]|uniref:Sugar ABC transporter ATP-binding protein n=1 Tax=Oscillibacter valericigenes TaxID=351091 RepID=A0ABS2FZ88_9FIRM|nr:sugar ABC transporter ATP-binding protein [Oscillibacter valericigenes]MBM6852215.1 sugar ABC transporter ATP-binding protein [Oscillibacter valericigenes]